MLHCDICKRSIRDPDDIFVTKMTDFPKTYNFEKLCYRCNERVFFLREQAASEFRSVCNNRIVQLIDEFILTANSQCKERIISLGLNPHIVSALNHVDIIYLDDLLESTFTDIMTIPNIGKISLRAIVRALGERDLMLRDWHKEPHRTQRIYE